MRAHWATSKLLGAILSIVVLVVGLGLTAGHLGKRLVPAGTFRTTDLVVDNTTVVKGNVGLCTDGTTSCTNIPHFTWSPT